MDKQDLVDALVLVSALYGDIKAINEFGVMEDLIESATDKSYALLQKVVSIRSHHRVGNEARQ